MFLRSMRPRLTQSGSCGSRQTKSDYERSGSTFIIVPVRKLPFITEAPMRKICALLFPMKTKNVYVFRIDLFLSFIAKLFLSYSQAIR